MSFIQNFYTSRDNNTDGNTYVGQEGRLWYNPLTNSIYVNTANVVGGTPVDLATNANIVANNLTVNTVTSTSGTVTVNGNLTITGNISPAATGKIGGITPGPGVDISNTGLLTIDSANLSFSFGNFTANNNILTIVNSDEDMILATQGNAEIQMVGNIGFYKSNGLPPDPNNLFFFAQDDGQIKIFVPTADPLLGAVEIIGSATGNSVSPALAGVMLHITGNPDTFASQYIDGINNFPNYIGRRYNGNVSVPTQVRAGNTIVRFSGQGYSTGGFNAPADGSISLDALEDFTATNQGAIWRFTVNPVGGNTRTEVANISVANGVTATQFTTTGNITAGNVNSFVTLPAGIAGQAPLVFTAGTLQTSATAGAMNFDGTVFYATPQDAERGLIVTEQVFIPNTDYPLIDQTAVQSMFGAVTTVSSNTRYAYRIMSTIYKASNNISLQFATGGNAVVAKHSYQTLTTATGALATASSPTVVKNVQTTAFTTPVTVSAALNGAGYYGLEVTGLINVTTAGTWFPQIAFTGTPGAGSNVFAGSSIEIWPIGPTGANVTIGNWS